MKTVNAPARIAVLDGIRGLAILLVVLWHYGQNQVMIDNPLISGFMKLFGSTWSGVDLFFVLSGYLIGGTLLDNRGATNYFKTFYIRRVCRIFPLYFAWLLLFVAVTFVVARSGLQLPFARLIDNPFPLWTFFSFTQNAAMARLNNFGSDWLSITWSLAVEEQFYLILPITIRLISPRKLPYVLAGAIVAAPILRVGLHYRNAGNSLLPYVLMPARADALLLGVACAYLVRHEKFIEQAARSTRWLYGVLILLLAGVGILTIQSPGYGSLAMLSVGYTLFALLYACFLLIAVVEKRGPVSYMTRNWLLGQLGILAYGVYIFHEAISDLAHGLLLGQATPQIQGPVDLLVTIFAFGLTIAIAYLSWSLFEKRAVLFGHTFKYARLEASPVTTGPQA